MKLLGCDIKNKLCHVNHCHVCKRKQDDGGVCQECTIGARNGWLWHLENHEPDGETPNYKPQECNICASILEGLKKE